MLNTGRKVLQVTGKDTVQFLQGMTTQNIVKWFASSSDTTATPSTDPVRIQSTFTGILNFNVFPYLYFTDK